MLPLNGLPDFQVRLPSMDVEAYAPFGAGACCVLPQQLNIASDAAGIPKFQLQLIKHAGDVNAAGQYGVLDLSLAAEFPMDDALTTARSATPAATIASASISSGFARLYSTTAAVALPQEITTPVALGWSGVDFARWTMRLPLSAAQLLQGSILNASILFGARVEFAVIGVAPRMPVFVQFEPVKLIAALASGKTNAQMAVTDLVAAFTTPGALPYTVIGTVPDAALFAQAMTDRIVAAYAVAVPSPDVTSPPFVALQPPASTGGGSIQWDLSQPVPAPRFWSIALDPLASLRAKAGTAGLASLVKEIAIPPLDLGFVSIDIAANLPAVRVGAPAMGASVKLAPNPPLRPAEESATVSFNPPEDRASANLRIGPAEALLYDLSAFAVWSCGRTVHKFDSPARSLNQNWLQLQPADFPVKFTHIKAEARLLALASIQGTLHYSWNGSAMQQPFSLTAASPELAIATPNEVTDVTVAISASPLDGSPALDLAPIAAARVSLDFTSFPQYGPHVVNINCDLDSAAAPLFVELLPDASIADPSATPSKFAFTTDQLTNRWGYVALSPFRYGYRFRVAAASDESPAPWSDVQSPFNALTLDAKGAIVPAVAVAAPMATAAG